MKLNKETDTMKKEAGAILLHLKAFWVRFGHSFVRPCRLPKRPPQMSAVTFHFSGFGGLWAGSTTDPGLDEGTKRRKGFYQRRQAQQAEKTRDAAKKEAEAVTLSRWSVPSIGGELQLFRQLCCGSLRSNEGRDFEAEIGRCGLQSGQFGSEMPVSARSQGGFVSPPWAMAVRRRSSKT